MIVSFAGHAHISSINNIKELVKEQLRHHIVPTETIVCYLGGYGDFDKICARACRELKKEYANVELVYVSPYITLSEQSKIKEMLTLCLYDTSLYPPIENTPKRFAISKRNEWMMKNADLVIAFVDHEYGGAYRSLQIAKHHQKTIINLCDLL